MTLGNMRALGVRLTASCLIGFVATIAYAAPAVVHKCGSWTASLILLNPLKTLPTTRSELPTFQQKNLPQRPIIS